MRMVKQWLPPDTFKIVSMPGNPTIIFPKEYNQYDIQSSS